MAEKYSYVGVTQTQLNEIQMLCPHDSVSPWFRVIPKEDIPLLFPQSFRDKMDHAVVMGSGDATGRTLVVINAHRVDVKDHAIDQEPFGIVLDTGSPNTSGIFIHHGDWDGRRNKGDRRIYWAIWQGRLVMHRSCEGVHDDGVWIVVPTLSLVARSRGTDGKSPSSFRS